MYPLGLQLAILIQLIILVTKISCIDLLNNPSFPCGIRYNSEQQAHRPEDTQTFQVSPIVARSLNDHSKDTSAKTTRQSSQLVGNPAGQGILMARLANEKFKDTEKHHEKVFPLTSRAKFVRASNTEKAPKNKTNHTKKPSGKPDNDDLKIKTRIIGGHQAKMKEFPWLVSIRIKGGSHICGGSILTDQYIITASHCVTDPSNNQLLKRDYQVGVGSSSWRDGRVYEVVKTVKHNDFAFETFENDVAIMKVSPKIELKKDVTVPICLPPVAHPIIGSATIAGWGKVNNQLTTTSKDLMMANIDILDHSYCKQAYSNYNDQKMLCAGTVLGERDSCNGDSGGPLQAVFPNGRVYLMGLVSFGDAICGKANTPGVYVRQSIYVGWINETIAKLSKM